MDDLVRRACRADGGIEICASVAGAAGMQREISRSEVDVVIAGTTSADGAELSLALLTLRPSVRVLLIAGHDAVAELVELRPERTSLGAVAPADIVRIVHDDAAHTAAWAAIARSTVGRER